MTSWRTTLKDRGSLLVATPAFRFRQTSFPAADRTWLWHTRSCLIHQVAFDVKATKAFVALHGIHYEQLTSDRTLLCPSPSRQQSKSPDFFPTTNRRWPLRRTSPCASRTQSLAGTSIVAVGGVTGPLIMHGQGTPAEPDACTDDSRSAHATKARIVLHFLILKRYSTTYFNFIFLFLTLLLLVSLLFRVLAMESVGYPSLSAVLMSKHG